MASGILCLRSVLHELCREAESLKEFGSNKERLKTDKLTLVHTLGSVFPPPSKKRIYNSTL